MHHHVSVVKNLSMANKGHHNEDKHARSSAPVSATVALPRCLQTTTVALPRSLGLIQHKRYSQELSDTEISITSEPHCSGRF